MNRRFHSRVDPFFYVPVTLVLGGTSLLMIMEGIWQPVIIILLAISFIIHMMINTWYEIGGGMLTIKCGFFYMKGIPLEEIKSIRPSRNPLSMPAFSLDRLEIRFGKTGYVLISPKEKSEFLNMIQRANPEIVIKG